ncbi:MAG: class I SAM-dependent methyltransferase, partial [Alphaproteobacteria bacterium]
RFEVADWPDAELVNSSFALPLCPPDAFDALWARIVASLKPGGRFAGQLYGTRDSWYGQKDLVFVDRARLGELLARLEVEMLDEEEDDSTTPRGETKHWHIFHIVARKPAF